MWKANISQLIRSQAQQPKLSCPWLLGATRSRKRNLDQRKEHIKAPVQSLSQRQRQKLPHLPLLARQVYLHHSCTLFLEQHWQSLVVVFDVGVCLDVKPNTKSLVSARAGLPGQWCTFLCQGWGEQRRRDGTWKELYKGPSLFWSAYVYLLVCLWAYLVNYPKASLISSN